MAKLPETLSESKTSHDLDEVCGRILGRTPLPAIGEAFAEVRRDENRRRVMMGDNKDPKPVTTTGHRPVETSTLVSRGPQFQKRSDSENTLDVCLTKSQLEALHKILETSTAHGSLAIQGTKIGEDDWHY
ncbi:hypothetical protein HRI_002072100 [Hibiscus trionum]|uniref:Uncharacterized protein n=1 Tax=Hibiscus trionum TaxID=183268 RepID=A0A9W7HV56_HIBTR|nr:hypothetical protein HRI_002072100 [Hibiscus trionum]